MHTNSWRLMTASAVGLPLLAGCGTRDERATNDSAGGTVAMTDSTGMSTTGTMNETAAGAMDPSIVSFVAMVNQSEIDAGQLAATKARNGDVKDYAKDMVDDHQKALQELRDLSAKSGWAMPDAGSGGATMGSGNTPSASGGTMSGSGSAAQGGAAGGALATTMSQMQQSHQAAMTKLRSASGAEFDRAYIDAQVAAHQQTLDVLRQHANSVQNSDLRSKVSDMQQDVEEHLRKAQELAQKLGGSRGGSGGGN